MHRSSCRFSGLDCEPGCDCRGCTYYEAHKPDLAPPPAIAGRCPHCGSTIHKAIGTGGAYCAPCDEHLDPWEYA